MFMETMRGGGIWVVCIYYCFVPSKCKFFTTSEMRFGGFIIFFGREVDLEIYFYD